MNENDVNQLRNINIIRARILANLLQEQKEIDFKAILFSEMLLKAFEDGLITSDDLKQFDITIESLKEIIAEKEKISAAVENDKQNSKLQEPTITKIKNKSIHNVFPEIMLFKDYFNKFCADEKWNEKHLMSEDFQEFLMLFAELRSLIGQKKINLHDLKTAMPEVNMLYIENLVNNIDISFRDPETGQPVECRIKFKP